MPRAAARRAQGLRFRGELLRELRKASGMTLQEIASEVGVRKAAVSKWERDIDHPEEENILALGRHFQLPADFFYDQHECRALPAAAVMGNVATFIQTAQCIEQAQHQIVVFQTGAPKA